MCVIWVVKAAWLVYKWQNYCTLAFTHFHLMTCTQDCALTPGDCETYLHLNWSLIVVNVVFIRIPILCRQIHDNYFSNNVSASKIIFFWGGHLFVRTSLPFCNNVTLTSVILFGALVMIFCLQTRVKICQLDICHK